MADLARSREVAAWGLALVLGLFVIASFTGSGTGMFGWGFWMGLMWLWMLLPLVLVLVVILAMWDRLGPSRDGPPREPSP